MHNIHVIYIYIYYLYYTIINYPYSRSSYFMRLACNQLKFLRDKKTFNFISAAHSYYINKSFLFNVIGRVICVI